MRFKQTTVHKTSLLLLLIMAILTLSPIATFASTPSIGTGSKIMVADIMSDVQSAQGSDSVDSLTKSADTAGNSVVKFLRGAAIFAIIVVLVLIGYGLFFSPNVKTLIDMKGRLGALIIGIFVAYKAEQIIGTLFMWLGIKIGG